MNDIEIEITHKGIQQMFKDLYDNEMGYVSIEIPDMLISDMGMLILIASEYFYYVLDMDISKESAIIEFEYEGFYF